MKAIGLIRVSTLNQDLSQQTEEVKRAILADGYDESDIILIEDKESAVKLSEEERQGLNTMKTYIDADQSINCVYVYELSRLSRRPEVLYSIRNWLFDHKIQLIVLKPYMKLLDGDRISETASIMFGIFGAMAEQEGYIRKARMARGKLQKQNLGKWVGGPILLGYKVDKDNNIIIDEETSKTVKYIFNEYVYAKRSTTSLATELISTGQINNASIGSGASFIGGLLKNVSFIGGKNKYVASRTGENKISNNIYPPIISEELFELAQKRIEEAKCKPKTTHKHIYFCKGLILDAATNKHLAPKKTARSYAYCFRTLTEEFKLSIQINLIDSVVLHFSFIYNNKHQPDKIKEAVKHLKKQYDLADKRLMHNRKQLDSLIEKEKKLQIRIISGKLSEQLGDEMIEDIRRQFKATQNQIVVLEEETTKLKDRIKYLMICATSVNKQYYSTDEDRRRLIVENVEKIMIDKFKGKHVRNTPHGTITIYYKDGSFDMVYYNSYTKKIWDKDMIEIEYEYLTRL